MKGKKGGENNRSQKINRYIKYFFLSLYNNKFNNTI